MFVTSYSRKTRWAFYPSGRHVPRYLPYIITWHTGLHLRNNAFVLKTPFVWLYGHRGVSINAFMNTSCVSIQKCCPSKIEITIIKIRRLWDCLIFIVEIPISMAQCKNAVSPLLTHWRYCSLALNHRYPKILSLFWNAQLLPQLAHDGTTEKGNCNGNRSYPLPNMAAGELSGTDKGYIGQKQRRKSRDFWHVNGWYRAILNWLPYV